MATNAAAAQLPARTARPQPAAKSEPAKPAVALTIVKPTVDSEFDPRFDRAMNVAQRIHLAETRVSYIQKDQPKDPANGGKKLGYSITSHDAVTALVRSHLVACGVIYYPTADSMKFTVNGNITMMQLAVRFENIDDRDDFMEVGGVGFGIDTQDKGPGKAISYAVKYALLKALGLETGDDPDQDQDLQRRSSTQQRADQLETTMNAAHDAASLKVVLQEPATKQIFASLADQEPAEYRRMRTVVAQQAKRVELDLKTLDQS